MHECMEGGREGGRKEGGRKLRKVGRQRVRGRKTGRVFCQSSKETDSDSKTTVQKDKGHRDCNRKSDSENGPAK
jgi:hypothetical protein